MTPARKRVPRKIAPSDNFTAGVEDDTEAEAARDPVERDPRDPSVIDIEDMIRGVNITTGAYIPPVDAPLAETTGDRDPRTFEPTEPDQTEPDQTEPEPTEPDQTIGEIVTDQEHALAEEPYMPGFAMSDEPLPIPSINFEPDNELPAAGAQQTAAAGQMPQAPEPRPSPVKTSVPGVFTQVPGDFAKEGVKHGAIDPGDDDIQSPRERRLAATAAVAAPVSPAQGNIRYEGRIRILEAFQYAGRLDIAPAWVDRNWLAHGDFDDLRQIPAGPCLRVPLPSGNNAIARIGDYVVQQEVVLAPGMPTDVRVEVWAKTDFEKNFLAVAAA